MSEVVNCIHCNTEYELLYGYFDDVVALIKCNCESINKNRIKPLDRAFQILNEELSIEANIAGNRKISGKS